MFDFKVININSHNISKGVQIFSKAMDFPIDIEQTILEEAKRFMSYKIFIGIGLQYNNSLVGLGSLIPMNGPTAWIPYVGVDPDFQGLGGGRLIMDNLLAIAKNNNWTSVQLVASHAGFPLYKKLGFRTDFPVAHYEIKSIKNDSTIVNLDVTNISRKRNLPEWVLQFDKEHLGIDRSRIFPIHGLKKLTLISQENHGYGVIYGSKIGPIISDSIDLARDILIKGFQLGANSATLPIDEKLIAFFNEQLTIEMFPNRDGIKMTYGDPILVKKESVIALRSMAFG